MSSTRHAEVAGGGLAGLTVATALAQHGWSVRLHERGSELREIGAGIFLWENALRVLERIGAYDDAVALGDPIGSWRLFDERGRPIQDDWMKDGATRLITVKRTELHQALAQAARRAGVQIETNSQVSGATPEGHLLLESGESREADLVVGADGVYSSVRRSLGLDLVVRDLEDGCMRHLVPRRPTDVAGEALEYWNGGRRVGIVPVTPDQVYIYTCCPAKDLAGRAQPFDHAAWGDSFRDVRHYIDRIPDQSRWAAFHDVRTHSWVNGRGAIVGDAATAMAPNLGQAACVAMVNGFSMASVLAQHDDIAAGLRAWEQRQRGVSDATQKYSRLYGKVGTRWPRPLADARSALVWLAGRSESWQHRVNVAAHAGADLVGPRSR
ncbi:FAD-dependent monooxygenase [Nocardioides glacieisoli]|uniref:FAD-dependent monooxygenase n=1 Tax=Nocardioides glacieisoli TaxID=1168730 RepID=UPI001A931767|nr:NAD(P)/FAD-dependent oxidoreductase [Nocardioides glacieisoli]